MNNHTIEIDWSNAFFLNGPLIEYDLRINENSAYIGKLTKIIWPIIDKSCKLNEYVNKNVDNGKVLRGYFTILNVQLKVETTFSEETSPVIQIPVNCTNKGLLGLQTAAEEATTRYLEPWIASLIFVIALFVLLSNFI